MDISRFRKDYDGGAVLVRIREAILNFDPLFQSQDRSQWTEDKIGIGLTIFGFDLYLIFLDFSTLPSRFTYVTISAKDN